MKTLLTTGYTFTPAQRRLDFSGVDGFDVRRLLAVIATDSGVILYAPGLAGRGYTSVTGSVVTLAADTTAMAPSARLLVYYDRDADLDPAWDGTAPRASVGAILRAIWSRLGGTLAVSAQSLPLPMGAATADRQDAAGTTLGNILTALGAILRVKVQVGGADVAAANPLPTRERSISGKVRDFAAGDADGAVGRLFRITCTNAGNVVAKLADGTTETIAVQPGYQAYPYEVVSVKAVGTGAADTTAAATYANLT